VKLTKPFSISKQSVVAAWEKVRANKGAHGIDGESIIDFEKDLKNNLYRLWNRMSSGTYSPPPVRAVEIPKAKGKIRILGIPTVSDRIAQTVVKMYLEPLVEPIFHEDSYGYRPNKSALDAVATARQRCWRSNWVIDLDIKGFFDNLNHELMLKALNTHTKEKWIHLYVERWLKAPMQNEDGELIGRNKGTPQGGVISPLLANLFMHYAFDTWMGRTFQNVKFERYADDCLAHCQTIDQAKQVLEAIRQRLSECGLELHPDKTKIAYCKDDDRRGEYEIQKFNFLGYTFRPRRSKNKYGKFFVNFTPAISNEARTEISKEIRSWKIHARSDKSLNDLAHMFNAVTQGWVNYYGKFYKSQMYPALRNIEEDLVLWVSRKYKRFRYHRRQARKWLGQIRKRDPNLFVHWRLGLGSPVQ
jgi:RNA-directed DNA polymerase